MCTPITEKIVDGFPVYPFGFLVKTEAILARWEVLTLATTDISSPFFFYPLELSFPWSPATGGLNNMSLEIRGGETKSASVKYAEACLKCFAQTFEQLTE